MEYYYIIHQSFLLLYNNIDINKIKFNLLYHGDSNNSKRNQELFNNENIFITYLTVCGNIICLYSKNSKPNVKDNSFCLFLDFNEVLYLCNKEQEKIKKNNKNEIFRKIIDKKKDTNYKYDELYYKYFKEKEDIFYDDIIAIEIYRIKFD